MINTITNALKDILNEFGFTKKITDDEIESSINVYNVDPTDHKAVSMLPVKQEPKPTYTGIPAPAYLEDDEWFGPAPIKTQKQLDYMEQEIETKRQEREQNFSVEPDDIHQKMYEIATKNHNTTIHLNPPGGSENFQEGPGGWNSGNGWGQVQK